MNNLLLVGNGFDLAHGLATSYGDFLLIMKKWTVFAAVMKDAKKGRIIPEENPFFKFACHAKNVDEDNLKKLGDIIQKNSWVKYYSKCEAEIDGWIDFEREIYPVIDMFEHVFTMVYKTTNSGNNISEVHIHIKQFTENELRIARLWPKYFDVSANNAIKIKTPFASMQYGILKKKILEDLRKEFDEFILVFELYLHEFVYRRDDVKVLKQIKDLKPTTVISFNYTLTEELYGIQKDDVHHIHGMLRKDLSYGNNNIVMGVNEQPNQNMDFIYFVKYFQRIQKASGVKYKELLQKRTMEENTMISNYTLYIYGHSLDETDEDILKYVIGDKAANGKLRLKPDKVIIFYYNPGDYEQKVINLIKLYGRSIVEEYMESRLFDFVQTTADVLDS